MERRSARIKAATAKATFPAFGSGNFFALDPEQPHETPDEIYQRMGARMMNPAEMDHNCPFCRRTMSWELFQAHAQGCMTRWFKTVDIVHRKFAGTGPVSTTIKGVSAAADSSAPVKNEV